jgi:hypothetical protein
MTFILDIVDFINCYFNNYYKVLTLAHKVKCFRIFFRRKALDVMNFVRPLFLLCYGLAIAGSARQVRSLFIS